MSKYDWSNVPSDVKWIATDSDGVVCGYSSKPSKFSLAWNCRNSGSFIAHSFVPPYSKNWQDSLEERPK